jgi:cellulose synthase/poly-beta-1,6-N-acetylglucosamine synthase-like glycosyltransferase
MSGLASGFVLAVPALLLIPVCWLLLQVVFALPRWNPKPVLQQKRPRTAILVPAHNEASGILNTLNSLMPQLVHGDRLLVVADNCTDETAHICRSAGAEVVERHDLTRRGKPYALDFGIRHLAAGAPEMVVIVDADCVASEGTIDRISRLSAFHGHPVQALDLMKAPPNADTLIQISEFACLLKNLVRPLGQQRLGGPCQLMGTGMAIPWPLIQSIPLASDALSEDLQMGVDCARKGRAPMFCPDASVHSVFPVKMRDSESQRNRWEQGHLALIVGQAPRLILEAILLRKPGMLALVADMCVPPLALLAIAVVTAVAACGVFALVSDSYLPLFVAIAGLLALLLAVFLAWVRFARHVVTLKNLAYVPIYAIGKLPIYLRFVFKRQTEWVRSRRDES